MTQKQAIKNERKSKKEKKQEKRSLIGERGVILQNLNNGVFFSFQAGSCQTKFNRLGRKKRGREREREPFGTKDCFRGTIERNTRRQKELNEKRKNSFTFHLEESIRNLKKRKSGREKERGSEKRGRKSSFLLACNLITGE